MKLQYIETPALVVDLDRLEGNMKKAVALLEGSGISLRPHYKSHKCPDLAKKQVEMGAKGITCAKLGEAQDLVDAGIKDVLIANQIVQPTKISRLAELAGLCYLTVCVDDPGNIYQLSEAVQAKGTTIHCLVEFDAGMGRCGTADFERIGMLAKQVISSPGLVFEGIQAYAGHLSHETDYNVRKREVEKLDMDLLNLKGYLEQKGMKVKEVSGGSTGTIELKCKSKVYTELQAGSYLFMDASYNRLDLGFENSLFLVSTVVSASNGRAVTDAGLKSCGSDQGMPVIFRLPGAKVKLTEEHGIVQYEGNCLNVGDTVVYIPGHCCTTLNLHDTLYLLRGDQIIGSYPVTSRGKFR